VAEIGINHNGDIETAKRLIDAAADAGCDAVKFQKRTPDLCVPPDQRNKMRETPWGYITYLDYRRRVEFGEAEYRELDAHCRQREIAWFVSCWDADSIQFMEAFDVPCYKIPSACLTNHQLLRHTRATGRPLILSTGMSSMAEIREAVTVLGTEKLLLTHCTSTYPCDPAELNLRMIETLRKEFDCAIGYSGHEVGLAPTVAAVALGACLIERHITLDRSMWGTDQSSSVEPQGFKHLVKYIRAAELAMGDGIKRVYDSELPIRAKLRGI
jgi:N-acetylneuraminate synthase